MFRISIFFIYSLIVLGCSSNSPVSPNPTPGEDVKIFRPVVVDSFPHDINAFTQGLLLKDGFLYESTGRYGSSTLRKVNLADGSVINSKSVSANFFAEGLAEMNGRLVQLTWQSQRAFVYDLATFDSLDTITYSGEGWGLTTDSMQYIMSNGSSTIVFRNENFDITRQIDVTLDGSPVSRLNELEFINGSIYANVWQRDYIVQIRPSDGKVTAIIECENLVSLSGTSGNSAVLNGIAYNPASNRYYLTGKLWPTLYEVELQEVESSIPNRQKNFASALQH
ncbi:MAG: glutaminyl-peptide cyclotransferase [Calditrichia bacterium]